MLSTPHVVSGIFTPDCGQHHRGNSSSPAVSSAALVRTSSLSEHTSKPTTGMAQICSSRPPLFQILNCGFQYCYLLSSHAKHSIAPTAEKRPDPARRVIVIHHRSMSRDGTIEVMSADRALALLVGQLRLPLRGSKLIPACQTMSSKQVSDMISLLAAIAAKIQLGALLTSCTPPVELAPIMIEVGQRKDVFTCATPFGMWLIH